MLASRHAQQIRWSIDALKDGVACYLPFVRALHSGELPKQNLSGFGVGQGELKYGAARLVRIRP
jgi:hypothetical protein